MLQKSNALSVLRFGQFTLSASERSFLRRKVVSLPGRISQGRTREEAIDGIREAIRLYIEVLKEDHLPAPEERFDTLLVAV